ncbi:alkaline ceramidase ydc1 [Coemansia sp. RSA 552]|nr:alkaline ceramidase ydc1 [Coemansia sp. RSA 552]
MGMIIADSVRNETSYFWGESNYIAEFWNCLTNITMIILALLGLRSSIRHGHGKRVTAMYVGLLFVGCGSACFHATLKYTTQLLDELPMLYVCAITFYLMVEIHKDVKFGAKFPVILGMFQLAITVTYLFWVQNPIFHQAAFALTAIGSMFFGFKRLQALSPSRETQRTFNRLMLLGNLGMWGGFFVWNLDNIFCQQLRSYRTYLGTPLDAVLQLHGWWHILTAYGSTSLILWTHMLHLAHLRQDTIFCVETFLGLFPYIELRQPKKID